MFSIIICSRASFISDRLAHNIKNTIGVVYEMIVIDNFANNLSLFEAYNTGLLKSKGEIVCFIHDDILIHTENWGKILNEIFKGDSQIGLVGVAGSKMKTKMPSAWWDCPENLKVINIIQHFMEENKEKEKWYKGFSSSASEEDVVVIDGVFMAMKKRNEISFSKEMSGFHNYDLNLAMEYSKFNLKTVVTNRILIEHFSIGSLGRNWYESTLKFDRLYKKFLPIYIPGAIDEKLLQKQEYENGINFVKGLIQHKFFREVFFYWPKLFVRRPFLRIHLNLLKNLLSN